MKKLLLLSAIASTAFANECRLVNMQCTNSSPTKVINGSIFKLADYCSKYGLTGNSCCWDSTSKYYCQDSEDTCTTLRKNANCSIQSNTCIDKDYITGVCKKFKSKFSCAAGFHDVSSRVCTDVICANNESGTAAKCFNPKQMDPSNTKNMGQAIAYIQMGQNMAQDMKCANTNDPSSCTLFSGKYYSCYMYDPDPSQPGSYHNGGADCGIHKELFNQANVPTGYAASDRVTYSQATSGNNNIMGNSSNYSMSSNDTNAINNSVRLHQNSNNTIVNQDQNINYNGNGSRNPNVGIANGNVVSVTINQDAIQKVKGFTSFENYLSDNSVNLAWNRQKSEPDPNNIKTITFADEGVTRQPSGRAFGWNSGINQPQIQGLCIHLADYCDGGDDDGTYNDISKATLSWAGSYDNPNFCAQAIKDPIFGTVLSGTPKATMQQWCCFSSKASLDINLAAYDQGLINIYTGNGSKYADQVNHPNGICGGVTVGMVSKIDFSKGDYFKDLMSSMDITQIIDNTNFTNGNIQNNTSGRNTGSASSLVNEWKNKNN